MAPVRTLHRGTEYPTATVRHIWLEHYAKPLDREMAEKLFDEALTPEGEQARAFLNDHRIDVLFS